MITKISKKDSKENIKKNLEKIERQKSKNKGFDAYKFCGAIKFKEDGLTIQKRLRDEWD
jgi:predicted ferric reductase